MRHLLVWVGLLLASLGYAEFSGTYEASVDGAKYTLTLKQNGDALTGEGKGDGQSYTFDGKVEGDRASGTVTVQGIPLTMQFRAEKSGKSLKLRIGVPDEKGKVDWSDADEFSFTQTSETKTAPQPKKDKEPSKEPTGLLKNGHEYVHATGGKFRYPANWSVKAIQGGVQLIPGDATQNEAYFVVAAPAEGATDAAAPDVVEKLDQQVRAMVPFVQRTGEIEAASAGAGKGAVLTWDGERDGKQYRVRGYITILKGYGLALVAIGVRDDLKKRDAVLRDIFFTFGWGQGKIDPALVGSWKHWSYSSSINGYGRETSAQAVLNEDGTFSYSSSTETSISVDNGSMVGRRGSGWSGTWTADGSTLILNFQDGSSETYIYKFKKEGANTFLVTTQGGGKPMEWSRK